MLKQQKNSTQGKKSIQTGAQSQWSSEELQNIEGFNKKWLECYIVRLSNNVPGRREEDLDTIRILPFTESEFEMVKANTNQNVEVIYEPKKSE